jgi:membrane protein DedA with SNARE-associated domain
LGLPLPEDIPLLISGALVAKGQMHLVAAAVAAWCGIIGGDIVLYHFGKRFGLEITRVRFIGKHLTKARIEQIEQMFSRYGIWVVAIGRMFAGLRVAMVVAAGAIRFNFFKFVVTDGLAAVFSGGLFIFLGHLIGSNLNADTYSRFKGEIKYWFWLGLVVVLLALLIWLVWKRRRDVEQMEKVTAKVDQVAGQVAKVAHITPSNPTERKQV